MRDPFNVTWIEKDKFMVGSMPTSGKDILALQAMGIRQIITVSMRRLQDCAEIGKALLQTAIPTLYFPISHTGIDPINIRKAAFAIDWAINTAHTPVFIHCRSGHHRSPMVGIFYYRFWRNYDTYHAYSLLRRRNKHLGTGDEHDLTRQQKEWLKFQQ